MTSKLKQTFDRDGYVVLEGFLDQKMTAEFKRQIENFIEHELQDLPREHVFYDDLNRAESLKQIQQLGTHSPFFKNYFHQGIFKELAEELLGTATTPKNLQYFNKPPKSSLPTPIHQDGFYFKINPPEAVTLWLALDPVDRENGCLRYIPQSHQKGLVQHDRTQTLGFSQGISNLRYENYELPEIEIHASPGDLIAHHALTVHRADANRSLDRSRRALGWIYYSKEAVEDEEGHQIYQSRLKNEMLEEGLI